MDHENKKKQNNGNHGDNNARRRSSGDDVVETMLLTLASADVIRLMQAHLIESGLHESCRILQQESGIGLAAAPPHVQWKTWAMQGQWANILKVLSMMDLERCSGSGSGSSTSTSSNNDDNKKKKTIMDNLIAEVHEMAILELAAVGDLSLAYAAYRLAQPLLQQQPAPSSTSSSSSTNMTRARLLEQKLAALAATIGGKQQQQQQQQQQQSIVDIPKDFYGPSNPKRDEVRLDLGERLKDAFPPQPTNRLTSLLQQAIKYQSYTGQLPQVKEKYHFDSEDEEKEVQDDDEGGQQAESKKTKKKKRKKRKYFDLVLGTTSTMSDPLVVGESNSNNNNVMALSSSSGSIPSRPLSTIKFGKRAFCESALFLPDASLVTGSTDGLIEIWDASQKYNALRMDLPYQQADNLLGHDDDDDNGTGGSSGVSVTALAVARDGSLLASGTSTGQVKIWRVDTGKCLRTMQCHTASSQKGGSSSITSRRNTARITCLSFSPDASRLLTASQDGSCREFGLRTAKMLQQFTTTSTGGQEYVTCCFYHVLDSVHDDNDDDDNNSALFVVTGSADGMVRFFHARTAQIYRIWRPMSFGTDDRTVQGSSIRVMETHPSAIAAAESSVDGSPPIQAVLPVYYFTSSSSSSSLKRSGILIVPRGPVAYLVNPAGVVERVFHQDGTTSDKAAMDAKVFCAATVSASHQWLFAIRQDGACCIFNIFSGKLERTVDDFALECTSSSSSKSKQQSLAEITTAVSHPFKSNMIAACSNDKGQKRGQLVVWK